MKQEDQTKKLATALLQKVLRFVADLPGEDIVALAEGRTTLEIVRGSEKGSKRKPGKGGPRQRDYDEISRSLSALASRDEGESLLADLSLNKVELQRLAARLDLPVMRDDSVERLRSKIIETTIGYRLRSRAILGQDRMAANEPRLGRIQDENTGSPKPGLR